MVRRHRRGHTTESLDVEPVRAVAPQRLHCLAPCLQPRVLIEVNGRLCILFLWKVDLLLHLSAAMIETDIVLYFMLCFLVSMVRLCWLCGNVCAAFERV
jgi:hypothetical protein